MRVGVIGAGAVGGALAALLDRAGHEVEVTARGAHLQAIVDNGLRLNGAWGEHTARVTAGEQLHRSAELVIVATKAQDAATAICENAHLLRGIPVVIVQNGLDGLDIARNAAPRSDIVGGLALFASSYLSPGHITVTGAGDLYVGGGSREHDVPDRYVASALGAVLPVHLTANFVGAQWTKLIVNQINALPAITGMSAQDVIAHPGLRHLMAAGMQEAVRVALASGIRFESLQGLGHRRLRLFAAAPLWIAQELPKLLATRMGDTPNPGSTLQSIRRGQLTEIDYLNGAVVRAAEPAGSAAPINALLVDLVHEVERGAVFLTPDDVLARAARVPDR